MQDKNKLLEKYGTEQVFAVPYSSTQNVPDTISECFDDLVLDNGRYVQRYLAEGDISMIQVIPCAIISNKDATRFFVTERIAGDERLQSKMSMIVGGHINPEDGYPLHTLNNVNDFITHALLRELNEEVELAYTSFDLQKWKLIRDLSSTTPDHIGIIYQARIDKGIRKVKIKENDTLKGIWMTKDDLLSNYNKFESWGRMIISHILTGDY